MCEFFFKSHKKGNMFSFFLKNFSEKQQRTSVLSINMSDPFIVKTKSKCLKLKYVVRAQIDFLVKSVLFSIDYQPDEV